MRKILFLLLVSSSITSCEKGAGTFVLKGIISDLSFDQKLEGAWVTLYKVPVATSSLIIVDSVQLSQDGTYEFSFPREQIEKYVIKTSKEGYFDLHEEIYFSTLTLENDNIRNFETYAKSWIGITIYNNAPLPTDHFRYIKQLGLEDCNACCPSSQQDYFGTLDTTIYCVNNGNDPYSLIYWVIGTTNSDIISQITSPFDTSYINITY